MTMASQNFTLNVLPEPVHDGDSVKVSYVGKCVEYDICVQASSVEQLAERFRQTIFGHILIAMKNGKTPFQCLPPGDSQVEGMFKAKLERRMPVTPSRDRVPLSLAGDFSMIPRGEMTLSLG